MRKYTIISLIIVLLLSSCGLKKDEMTLPKTALLAEETESTTGDIAYVLKAELSGLNNTPTIAGEQLTLFTNNSDGTMESIVFHLYADSYNAIELMPEFTELPSLAGTEYTEENYLGDINITGVTVDNKAVTWSQDNQALIITDFGGVESGETAEIQLEFQVKIPYSTQRLGYYENIYSITQWYPLLAKYDGRTKEWDTKPYHPIGESDFVDAADYAVEMKVPADFGVVSSGKDEESIVGETKTVTSTVTAARHFVFITSPRYAIYEESDEGVTFRSAYLKDSHSEIEGGVAPITVAKQAFAFYKEKVGAYIYPEFDIAETGVVGFAMEYSGLIQMGLYGEADELPVGILAHEMAHQWWYSAVGDDAYNEPFIDEGFTSFMSTWFMEEEYNEEYYLKAHKENINFSRINRSVEQYKIGSYDYYTVAYEGPTVILFDLKELVGENVFEQIMKTFYKENTKKFGTLNKFISTVEANAGKEIAEKVEEAFSKKHYYMGDLLK